MAYRKQTLRRLQPFSRKLARLANDVDSLRRRLRNLVDEAQQLELEASATRAMQASEKREPSP